MSLPPIPLSEFSQAWHQWFGVLKTQFERLSDTFVKKNDIEEELKKFVIKEEYEEDKKSSLDALEANLGIVQRKRVYHINYPADTYVNGRTSVNPALMLSVDFQLKNIANIIWFQGVVAWSSGSQGNDADGMHVELFANGSKVDDFISYVQANDYDNTTFFLEYLPNSTDLINYEIKAWSTMAASSGTRFRSPGTYGIIEELKEV